MEIPIETYIKFEEKLGDSIDSVVRESEKVSKPVKGAMYLAATVASGYCTYKLGELGFNISKVNLQAGGLFTFMTAVPAGYATLCLANAGVKKITGYNFMKI